MYGIKYHFDTAALSLGTFFDTIDRNFFTPNFDTYEHMRFFNDPTAFKILVIGLYIGIVIASLVMYYNKHVLGGFIRRVDELGALSPETARTLEELGYSKNPFIKLSLKTGYSLRRVISYVPSGEGSERAGGNLANAAYAKEKLELLSDRFYIPQEKRDVTVGRFRVKGSGWLTVLLFAVVGIVAVVLVFKLAPFAVGLLESMIAGFSGSDKIS